MAVVGDGLPGDRETSMGKRFVTAAMTAILVTLGSVVPASAENALEVEAMIDGRDVSGAGSSDPVVIDPAALQVIDLTLTNTSESPVTVRRVRLSGELGGLTMVAYDVTTDLEVDSGATESVTLPVEFAGLEQQALGLLPGGLVIFDDERSEVGSEDFVIDVEGDLTSVMGLFTIFMAIATGIGLAVLATRVARRTLIGNRFRRGLQFAAVGLGVGVTLIMGLAVLGIVAPTASVWVPLLIIPTAAAGALGYLSPGPLDFEPDEIDEIERQMAGNGPEPASVG